MDKESKMYLTRSINLNCWEYGYEKFQEERINDPTLTEYIFMKNGSWEYAIRYIPGNDEYFCITYKDGTEVNQFNINIIG